MPGKVPVSLPALNKLEQPRKLCPTCVAEKRKSTVQIGFATRTAMATNEYFDAEGFYHYHDPNIRTIDYRCSNGHDWQEEETRACWCGRTR